MKKVFTCLISLMFTLTILAVSLPAAVMNTRPTPVTMNVAAIPNEIAIASPMNAEANNQIAVLSTLTAIPNVDMMTLKARVSADAIVFAQPAEVLSVLTGETTFSSS